MWSSFALCEQIAGVVDFSEPLRPENVQTVVTQVMLW